MPEYESLETRLDELIEPVAAERGLELVEVALAGGGAQRVLRVTIDRVDSPGKVTVNDCASLSRELSALLDVEDPIPGHYSLEVSSPGVERPLRKRRDFERFAGEKVAVVFRTESGRSRVEGRLLGIDATDQILLDTRRKPSGKPGSKVSAKAARAAAEDADATRVALAAVEKAHIVFHFGRGAHRK